MIEFSNCDLKLNALHRLICWSRELLTVMISEQPLFNSSGDDSDFNDEVDQLDESNDTHYNHHINNNALSSNNAIANYENDDNNAQNHIKNNNSNLNKNVNCEVFVFYFLVTF